MSLEESQRRSFPLPGAASAYQPVVSRLVCSRATLRTVSLLVAPGFVELLPAFQVHFVAVFNLDGGTLFSSDRFFTDSTDYIRTSLFPHERTPSMNLLNDVITSRGGHGNYQVRTGLPSVSFMPAKY
jgi:hypothetical protein